MPAFRTIWLIAPAIAAFLASGCTTQMGSGLETGADFSYAGGADLALPETVSVLPSSFAGPSPSASFEVASLSTKPDSAVSEIAYAKADTPRGEVDRLIAKYAAIYEVPEALVRRVVKRESNFNPAARNRIYWGLMQIRHDTARGMGYDGPASGLLDAETNLKYAVKYLRGAWLVAEGDQDRAVRFYASGYYYGAKRKGLLDETGLGRDRVRKRA